jgi:hypothetical protein
MDFGSLQEIRTSVPTTKTTPRATKSGGTAWGAQPRERRTLGSQRRTVQTLCGERLCFRLAGVGGWPSLRKKNTLTSIFADGVNLDSAGHFSHMSYPEDVSFLRCLPRSSSLMERASRTSPVPVQALIRKESSRSSTSTSFSFPFTSPRTLQLISFQGFGGRRILGRSTGPRR